MPDYVLPAGDARAADELEASVLVSVGMALKAKLPSCLTTGSRLHHDPVQAPEPASLQSRSQQATTQEEQHFARSLDVPVKRRELRETARERDRKPVRSAA